MHCPKIEVIHLRMVVILLIEPWVVKLRADCTLEPY